MGRKHGLLGFQDNEILFLVEGTLNDMEVTTYSVSRYINC